ncbi:hypothetical protein CANCADRAFT_86616 [Tortispora caseinolytica NRRL Y-17796]|uniref:glycerol kinase n=1 Tax=Tortispora caseinolytica NRRL Y-17796 TaxID=767744 RepID=A0A1E4TKY9_9ASCO|nr:hypothetical protein CANCADRAFT_86616 [Tortispora caseinolytica NRRL Y-17796]
MVNALRYIGAIDQGTTSTRFIVFDTEGKIVSSYQKEVDVSYPQSGYVEHDPCGLFEDVKECIDEVLKDMEANGLDYELIEAIGLTNQRETTVVWDSTTGKPLHSAIVWSDVRTSELAAKYNALPEAEYVRKTTGLNISSYFFAVKLRWLLENVPDVRTAKEAGTLMAGTVDSWLLYNFSGGKDGGIHVTDASNASRYLLIDIRKLEYDPALIKFFGVEGIQLPKIVSSAEKYCMLGFGKLQNCPVSGCLGDQSAALVGQKAFKVGQCKATYGTGAFILYNTGNEPVMSSNGLLTTVGYHFKGMKPVYALEGSIAVAGSALQWAKDRMGLIQDAKDVGPLAASVPDTGGVVFVTGFSGLFAPYWIDSVRGTVFGITSFTTKAHIVRALVEAICFQTDAIMISMSADAASTGEPGAGEVKELRVDGGMSASDEICQIQADILGFPLLRPLMKESSAFGAALAAGIGAGVWNSIDELDHVSAYNVTRFESTSTKAERSSKLQLWDKAVRLATGWTT